MSNLRERINNSPAIAIAVAVAALAAVAFMLYWLGILAPNPSVEYEYLYNMQTGQLESYPVTDPPTLPPIQNETGQTLVRAHVYSMTGCDDDPPFIAWIEQFTEEGKRRAERRQQAGDDDPGDGEAAAMVNEGREIALPPKQPGQPARWIPGASPEARQLQEVRLAEIRNSVEDGDFQQCWPEQ